MLSATNLSLAEMSSQPLGVAVAGLGFGEKVHLPALKANQDLKAVALWHPRHERLDQACAESGLQGYDNWDALLADPAVDAVIVATPPEPRFDLARAALEAGKHVLLEKPIALHADQAMELQRLSSKATAKRRRGLRVPRGAFVYAGRAPIALGCRGDSLVGQVGLVDE